MTSEVVDNDTAITGTNVEYAAAINNGHMQNKRFLPAKYLNTPNGRKYLGNNGKGIMLKAKYIKGVHFMEKGIQNAQQPVEEELDRWFNELLKELG